jgi:hypothetical protein
MWICNKVFNNLKDNVEDYLFLQGNKKTLSVSSDIDDSGKLLLPYDLPLKPYQKEGELIINMIRVSV